MRPSDFSIIHLENEFIYITFTADSYELVSHGYTNLYIPYSLQIPMNFSWLYGLLY